MVRIVANRSYHSRRLGRDSRETAKRSINFRQVVLSIVIICVSSYSGAISGKKASSLKGCYSETNNNFDNFLSLFMEEDSRDATTSSGSSRGLDPADRDRVHELVEEQIREITEQRKKRNVHKNKSIKRNVGSKRKDDLRIGGELKNFLAGTVKTSKDELMNSLDIGVPRDHNENGKSDALIFYSTTTSLPTDTEIQRKARQTTGIVPSVGFKDATENCDSMDLVYTLTSRTRATQCVVILENYEGNTIQKWLRTKDKDRPLVPVSRCADPYGKMTKLSPSKNEIKQQMQSMKDYLNTFQDILKRLQPIVEAMAQDNTVIVMVVNKGQSELLMNFVCSSRAQGFDLNSLLVFATDEATHEIVVGLGVTSFYDEKIFKNIPEQESKFYGSSVFASIMYAKVVSVQLVNYLGFDVLFQDVDIIWFKNPLELFHDENSPLMKFDMLFQDDGVRSTRYAPYSANSGFYYVRHNKRTRYLLISLLYQGDLIENTGSHQEVLGALLMEQSSTYGLRVKVLDGYTAPGGYQYHSRKAFMKKIVHKEEDPYLFHMSWTLNKDNKLKFMKQMGWWYINDQCFDGMMKANDHAKSGSCCVSKPEVVCFYSDKPSAIPCTGSPQIDKTGKQFW